MFDIGFLEMMTIGIVALVVIGPERLPAVAAKVGRYVGKAQRFVRGVRSDISRELETGDLKKLIGDQKSQIDELRQMMDSAKKDIETSTGDAFKDAEKSMTEIKRSTLAEATGATKSTSVSDSSTGGTSPTVSNEPELLNDTGITNPNPPDESPDTGTQANDKAS